jgi:hypothetical protein
MDVADQLPQISILLANNGLVPVLEQLAIAPMAPIEAHHLTREQPLPQVRQTIGPASKQKMCVVAHQHPGIAASLGLRNQILQSPDEVSTISSISEDRPLLDPPDNDVVDHPGRIDAC